MELVTPENYYEKLMELVNNHDVHSTHDENTEVPIDFQKDGNLLCVIWESRAGHVENSFYDLSLEKEMNLLLNKINVVIEDLINY